MTDSADNHVQPTGRRGGAFDAAPADAIRCLKLDGTRQVWLIHRVGQRARILKQWPVTPWLLMRLLLGIAPPQRQIRGTRHLRAAGIPTPEPLITRRIERRRQRLVFVIELSYVDGETAWELARHDRATLKDFQRSVGAAIGDLVAQLISAGLFNRDLKLANILVGRARDDRIAIWVLDPVGVRRSRDSAEEAARMLERLGVMHRSESLEPPRAAVMASVHHTLRAVKREDRRAVIQRLRAHLRRESDRSRRASGVDPR
jgi:tRNA A-37 threonylcarbamoyl transferase component Bud32